MNFKRDLKKLKKFKQELEKFSYLEETNIKKILNWVKKRQKKN
mgnify:CR=1 FL=1